MKKLMVVSFIAILTFVFAIQARAEEEGAEKKEAMLSGVIESSGYSAYVAGMGGAVLYDDPVVQASVTVSHNPSGLYVNIWGSHSPNGHGDFGDEVDYAVGIERAIGSFNVDAGYSFYDMYKVGKVEGDLHALYLTLCLPEVYGITPFISLEGDLPTDREILEGGVLWQGGFRGSVPVVDQPIDWQIDLSGHDGTYGYRPEVVSVGSVGISTTFQVWKLDVTPDIRYQKRLGFSVEDGGMAEDKLYGGVSLSYSFDIL